MTYVEAELETAEISFVESNTTWGYNEEQVRNENGVKTVEYESDGGDYSVNADQSLRIGIGGESFLDYKSVRDINYTEMDTILKNADINLTLDAGDKAQLQFEKSLVLDAWWNDKSYDPDTYANLHDFIAVHEYNSSKDYLDRGVLYREGGHATIIFAQGSAAGNSGKLVEVSWENQLLTNDAGTWHIETMTDDNDIDFDALVLDPTLCGYENRMFKLGDQNHIYEGSIDSEPGDINANIQFNDSLKEKLKTYFIQHSILDVDPK